MISVVIESWNVEGRAGPLERLLCTLAPQLGDAELVITHAGIPERARLERAAGRAITWLALPAAASYYDHKNRGFDATTGEIVAFLDADCDPAPGWLQAITAPIAAGRARVVAGATTYRGVLAPLASRLDFPYVTFDRTRGTVLNFFANNVAFARDVFAAHRYPVIAPMYHGQCQVLCLQLHAAGIAIQLAADARATHAWPDGIVDWLTVRLLRGADTVSLLPHVVAHVAPRATLALSRMGRVPALAVIGLRAANGAWIALRDGPVVRGLALVAAVTLVDALGATAGAAVYRALA
jgi:hypothetical protein